LSTKFAVALVTDENQFPIAVFLASQLAHLNPRDDTDIVIVSDAENEFAKAADFGVPARLHPVDKRFRNNEFATGNYVSQATYYRLFLADMFAEEYRRVIYLDLDTYIHDARLFSLPDLDMSGHVIGGVRDSMIAYTALPINLSELRNTLSGGSHKYLNGGINLIDTHAFRAAQTREKVIEAMSRKKVPLQYNDQTALNFVLDGGWLELSPSFNMFVPLWNSFVREVCEPVVVHFAGPNKPWHGPAFVEDHPIRPEMERFLAASPWKDFRARFFNVKTATAQAAPKLSLGPGLQKPTRPAVRSITTRAKFDMKGFIDYLSATNFADVAQGLTTPRFDRIPAPLKSGQMPTA
jgi:lipopolysaccharide biosynthesis glycosyltransferase